ncbi:LamB/YcsF family protein [Amycolatopsis sp. EV170708-02-1]|uniref:LamB/YcsF family protein n=1 Tax=Amycolatopsis sp. EV170708-02-1 TaxID=2919322 RepID=UPI001F0BFF0F|nr:5-oxoprolinase subunit PxpA [Amycolatopsis sp. EV170708-02-1]UMP07423.1 LamB/YcsF family protein [Amycolatopsis sp. EV170708-02-1]
MDLNSDLGEGFGAWKMGDDDAMLDIVTSANVACGFHAGDPSVMRRVCERAAERGVVIGAHVAYRDLAGFGRRAMDVAPADLADDVLYQIGALDAFARAAGTSVRYVKPHGALYNTAAVDPEQAAAVVEAIRRFRPGLALLCPPGSEMAKEAETAGFPAYAEAFADRAYTPEGLLVSRKQPGAVLHDADEVASRAVAMATTGKVVAADGTELALQPHSLCVHGDTPGAVELARRIRAGLDASGVHIGSFLEAA